MKNENSVNSNQELVFQPAVLDETNFKQVLLYDSDTQSFETTDTPGGQEE